MTTGTGGSRLCLTTVTMLSLLELPPNKFTNEFLWFPRLRALQWSSQSLTKFASSLALTSGKYWTRCSSTRSTRSTAPKTKSKCWITSRPPEDCFRASTLKCMTDWTCSFWTSSWYLFLFRWTTSTLHATFTKSRKLPNTFPPGTKLILKSKSKSGPFCRMWDWWWSAVPHCFCKEDAASWGSLKSGPSSQWPARQSACWRT